MQLIIEKPLLRGYFHQAAFFLSIFACGILLSNADGAKEIFSSVFYSFSLCGLFAVSSLYHRIQWNPVARMWMRRLDHSFIFILILGTAVPICMLALSEQSSFNVLLMVSIAAGVGVLQALFWVKAPKFISISLYVLVGWLVVPYIAEFKNSLGFNHAVLLVLGGVTYTLGAVIYALKYPNPSPRVFGYHEIFHILVIVAAAFHFAVIFGLVH